MRLGPLLFVALGAALAGGALRLAPSVLRAPAPAGGAEAAGENGAAAHAGALRWATDRAAEALGREEPLPAERTYYRYIDASGSLRFVDSLERVPEAFRATAKPMAMGSGNGENEAPQLTRAETRPPRRPFARRPASQPARGAPEGFEDEATE
jgi:hypothetical protein